MKISRDQMNNILSNAPAGVDKQKLMEMYIEKGYEIEGIDTEQAKQYITQQKFQPVPSERESVIPQPEKKQNFFQRVGERFRGRREEIKEINESDITGAEKVLQHGGQVAGGVFDIVSEAPVVKQGLELFGKGVQKLSETEPFQRIGERLSPVAEKGINAWESLPENIQNDLDAAFNISVLLPGVGGVKGVKSGLAKTVPGAFEKTVVGTGKAFKGAGEGLASIGAPLGKTTKVFEQAYQASKPTLLERVGGLFGKDVPKTGVKPITEASTAVRHGLVGTQRGIGVQALKASKKLWTDVVAPSLKGVKEKVNMKEFFAAERAAIIKEVPDLVRRDALLKGLAKVEQRFKNVSNITAQKLQSYKEGWRELLPESVVSGQKVSSGVLNNIRERLSSRAMAELHRLTGKKQAYIDYGNLKSISELGLKSIDQWRSKFGGKQLWELVLDTAVVPVTTAGAQVLYRTGQGIEFIGAKGAKTLRDILGTSIIGNE